MTLKFTVDSIDAVPEALRSFYTEKDGKFSLAVEGAVPKARLDEFRDNNVATRRELDELRARFDGVDPDKFRELSDKAAKDRDKKLIDAGKVDELVAERVAAMKAASDKHIEALTAERSKAQSQLESLLIDSAIRDAGAKAGVRPTAIEDVLLRGRQMFRLQDGKAVAMEGDKVVFGKDGEPMPVHEWVSGLSERAPHLFDTSAGGKSNTAKPGSTGAKTMTRSQFDALPLHERATAIKGLTLVDD